MSKQFKYIIAGLFLMVAVSSCKKGWLDVTSSDQIKADEQFETETGFKDALIGAYIGMTDPSLYSKDMTWNIVDILSQQYNSLQPLAPYYEVSLYSFKAVRSMPKVDAMWNKQYNVIANVNSALSYIDKNRAVLNNINYSIIKGELLGLRAFLHFDLMRLYGYGNIAGRPEVADKLAIPYVTNFDKDITPQLSYTQTFNLLEKDINESLELLKEDLVYKTTGRPADYYTAVNRNGFYNNRQQRMNYYAVKALQARAFIWKGGIDNLAKAASAAEEVINNSPAKLIADGASVATDRILLSEHIFSLNVAGFINIVNQILNAELATNVNALYMIPATTETLYEISNTGIGPVDKRYNTLLQSLTLGKVSVKLQQRETSFSTNNIMPLIKVPEMYYIAAEHYMETNLPKAIQYLNKVRRSRGIIVDIDAGSNKATVANELMKEYRKEFIMEGQLFFFYKRLGKTTFPGLPVNIVANDKIYLLPYPNSEVEAGNRIQ